MYQLGFCSVEVGQNLLTLLMAEIVVLLTAKIFIFQEVLQSKLLYSKDQMWVCIVSTFHRQITSRFRTSEMKMGNFTLVLLLNTHQFAIFQTLPDFEKNRMLSKLLMLFFKILHYRDHLGKIRRNSQIHDCRPIFEKFRSHLLKNKFTMTV